MKKKAGANAGVRCELEEVGQTTSEADAARAAALSRLPTQYQLCRIAASLPDASKKPVQAVQYALALWLSAGYELSKAKKRHFIENLMIYSEDRYAEGDSLEEAVRADETQERRESLIADRVAFGDSEQNSEAMRCVNAMLKDRKHEVFKFFTNFQKAWDKHFGNGPRGDGARIFCCRWLCEQFVKARVAKSLAEDAERKRKTRALKKMSK